MIRNIAAGTLAAVLLAGCQSIGPGPAPSPMSGIWASTDGVFVARFADGRFVSRFTKTNEVLAEGSYSMEAGRQVSMRWLSIATKQQRSATCSFTGPNRLSCKQTGAGAFDLVRSA
ncbi:hypothetical protein [Propylenella binzhouense]|uniref:Outer membrane lipoprotein n=1 Tax=Propylenella binzhouense TaxID=2555902 RepID=A0A964T9L6_9HYPH|nr:hypothetical protein [Propylenella binzhouense]MYZ50417.1 hypothetical protein [Propylenella binzhouense]